MQSVYSGSAMYTENDVTGEIQLGLSYSESDQTLNVSINKARGLTAPKDDESSANPYVTMVLYYFVLPHSSSIQTQDVIPKGSGTYLWEYDYKFIK